MAAVDYPRHFVLLVGATVVLALVLSAQPIWTPAPDRLFVLFGLSGALHAVAVVLAIYPRSGFAPGVRTGLGCEYDVPAGAFMVLELRPGAPRASPARSGTTRRSRACEGRVR